MGRPRLELQAILSEITDNVYFQPPTNAKIKYPCIIYKRDFANTDFANNGPYQTTKRYQVIVIDQNPDSDIPDKVSQLQLCTFNRFYTADDLNHDVYNLFF